MQLSQGHSSVGKVVRF